MNYLIKKKKAKLKIKHMNYKLNGYIFTPKFKDDSILKIKEIRVININLIDNILAIKFNKMFKNLFAFVIKALNTSNDEDNSGNAMYALTEIERLKSILFNNYQNYLSIANQQLFYNKLNMLEQQIKINMMMNINYAVSEAYAQEETKGRGR